MSRTRRAKLGAVVILLAWMGVFACAPPPLPERHALVVGVANYEDPDINDLMVPDDDANSMAACFTEDGYTVVTQIDAAATKDGILAAIAAWDSLPEEAMVLVYFSGHGFRAETASGDDMEYIAPWDTVVSPSVDIATLISSEELLDALESIQSRHRILILDSCFSGGFIPDGSGGVDFAPERFDPASGPPYDYPGYGILSFETMARIAIGSFGSGDRSVIVLSAAGSGESSWEDGTHGIFTAGLLASRTRGDKDGDGFVTTSEAFNYARERVKREWNELYGDIYDDPPGEYRDFLPRMDGGSRDYILFETP
ncbi:MAG: caspase family protein [Spirochaetes bacterium]|nr:caspase family protein [Spirochaetota bacterium]